MIVTWSGIHYSMIICPVALSLCRYGYYMYVQWWSCLANLIINRGRGNCTWTSSILYIFFMHIFTKLSSSFTPPHSLHPPTQIEVHVKKTLRPLGVLEYLITFYVLSILHYRMMQLSIFPWKTMVRTLLVH